MKDSNGRMPLISMLALGVLTLSIYGYSQSNYGPAGSNPRPNATATATPAATASPLSTPGVSGAITIQTAQGSQGAYLVDGKGRSLYLFAADSPGTSTCSGACAQVWPPLTVATGQTVTAAGGAQQSLLGTTTRPDGSTQVTYNGWPLYYYAPDQNPGDVTGQAITSYGAPWYLVTPDGKSLQSAAAGGAGMPY